MAERLRTVQAEWRGWLEVGVEVEAEVEMGRAEVELQVCVELRLAGPLACVAWQGHQVVGWSTG